MEVAPLSHAPGLTAQTDEDPSWMTVFWTCQTAVGRPVKEAALERIGGNTG